MLRHSISIKSSTSSIRRLLNIMASKPRDLQSSLSQQCNGLCLCQSADHCIKSPFKRTVSSCSTSNGQGEATGESVERSREREGLQWDKLSEDEKNIYFAHESACAKGDISYVDPITGYAVFTEEFLKKQRSCCGNGCRHCPYGHENVPKGQRRSTASSRELNPPQNRTKPFEETTFFKIRPLVSSGLKGLLGARKY